MDSRAQNKLNRIEARIYEALGVKLFRKAILLCEKIRHCKDGNRNENYHPKSTSVSSLKSFAGYLIYNALFHVVSILLVIVYFAIAVSLQLEYLWIDIVMYIVAAVDLYCIMLQRYLCLRMRVYISKATAQNLKRIRMAFERVSPLLDGKDGAELQEETELLEKLHTSQCTGEDCILTSNCAEIINRLALVAEQAQITYKTNAAKDFSNVALSISEGRTRLRSNVEQRVSKIQKLLSVEKTKNVSFGYCIITEDKQCEDAFRRLFPDLARDRVEFTVAFLLAVYEQKGPVAQ